MNNNWLTKLGGLVKHNSPAILSGVAIGGVIVTAYLAARAAPEAKDKLAEIEPHHPSNLEKAGAVWQYYVPAGISAAATIGCIVWSGKISSDRTAAMAAAYAITDQAFRNYKDHVLEEIGEQKERKIRDKISEDHLKENPPDSRQVILTGLGDQLCYDPFTDRYFRSDIETIRRAVNDINAMVIKDMWCSHNEFYDLIGLEHCDAGNEMGWNLDHLMEVDFGSHLGKDGVPVLSIQYKKFPKAEYGNVY